MSGDGLRIENTDTKVEISDNVIARALDTLLAILHWAERNPVLFTLTLILIGFIAHTLRKTIVETARYKRDYVNARKAEIAQRILPLDETGSNEC